MAAVGQEMSGNGCRVTLRLLSGSSTIGSSHSSHLCSAPPAEARTCDRAIISRFPTVYVVLTHSILAGRVRWVVQPVRS
jgi:hypothetical protein